MRRNCSRLSVLLVCILGAALNADGDMDDDLAPSKTSGAEVQALLKPDMTTDELFQRLRTTPARVRKNRFHWQLADGSIWTDFLPTNRGMRIVGWIIESDSSNATGGETDEFNRLFSRFYQNPDATKVSRILELAAILQMFEEDHNRQSMTIFLAPIFRAHPELVEKWAQLPALSQKQRQVIYAAIAEAELERADDLFHRLKQVDPDNRPFIDKLFVSERQDVLERDIDAPMDLDALWAGFFATGDRRYIERICSVFSWDVSGLDRSSEKWRINGAAAWSVGANARRHPIVAQVCKDNAPIADELARPIYERILAEMSTTERLAPN